MRSYCQSLVYSVADPNIIKFYQLSSTVSLKIIIAISMCMMNKTLVSLLTFPVVSILSEMYNFHTVTSEKQLITV